MNGQLFVLFLIMAVNALETTSASCSCSDESGSACWDSQDKRNARCGSKGFQNKNYCARTKWKGTVIDCANDCYCCGSSMNSGCKAASLDEAKGVAYLNDQQGYKCYKTEVARNSNCGRDYKYRCQGRKLVEDETKVRMTYCCAKSGYPKDIC